MHKAGGIFFNLFDQIFSGEKTVAPHAITALCSLFCVARSSERSGQGLMQRTELITSLMQPPLGSRHRSQTILKTVRARF